MFHRRAPIALTLVFRRDHQPPDPHFRLIVVGVPGPHHEADQRLARVDAPHLRTGMKLALRNRIQVRCDERPLVVGDFEINAGAEIRLRPVLMTAMTTVLGLLPLLLAEGIGADVQRPLATVVIFGLTTSTLLTLFVIPAVYVWKEERIERKRPE